MYLSSGGPGAGRPGGRRRGAAAHLLRHPRLQEGLPPGGVRRVTRVPRTGRYSTLLGHVAGAVLSHPLSLIVTVLSTVFKISFSYVVEWKIGTPNRQWKIVT